MNTETHGLKKMFYCFKQKGKLGGLGTRDYQCKSVANSGVLGWVLKKG